jgi:phosphoglycolate phosphatase
MERNEKMTIQAVIFDLDGTLLDTLADIADAVNRVLAANFHPGHAVEAYRWFVGDGSAVLIKRALPPNHRDAEKVRTCLEDFIADYTQHWRHKTAPYPGIMELLERLQDRRFKLAVVTNKPHRFSGKMVAHYFPGTPFDPIFGQREGIPKKPDPTQALAAAQQMQVAPRDCLFVGDSAVDMETARRAGMGAIGADWGFRPRTELIDAGAEHIIDHPMDLFTLLDDKASESGAP